MKSIKPWYAPIDDLHKMHGPIKCEMTRRDHGFLCGMIKSVRPKKIVEIGVASGGTTSVILKTIAMLQLKTQVYSVDINERFYSDPTLDTGFEYKRIKTEEHFDGEQLLTGKTIAGRLDEIGDDIDFVVLDTTHALPGEVLDFLAILPYCTYDATFILHDVNVNYLYATTRRTKAEVERGSHSIATKLLYSVVAADKFINSVNDNIAGFQINDDTWKAIDSMFYVLTSTWQYQLSDKILKEYKSLYERHYSKELSDVFDVAVRNNIEMSEWRKMLELPDSQQIKKSVYRIPYDKIPRGSDVIIYGAGYAGREVEHRLRVNKYCNIAGWLDKAYKTFSGEKIEAPTELLNKKYDYILIAVESEIVFLEIKEELIELTGSETIADKLIGPLLRR